MSGSTLTSSAVPGQPTGPASITSPGFRRPPLPVDRRARRRPHVRLHPRVGRVRVAIEPWPALLVAALVVGSIGASALTVGQGAARPPSTPMPLDSAAFRALPSLPLVEAAPSPSPSPTGDRASRAPVETVAPHHPEVVRFRPPHGARGVSPQAEVSVRFSEPMERRSTATAFRVLADGQPVGGTVRWAEGDTVLVLRPTEPLPYGARVQLVVDPTARSAVGIALAGARSVTFTVGPRPTPAPRPTGLESTLDGWQWPLLGPITQGFGESLTAYGNHQGIDIDGDTGDAVRAAHDGRVTVVGEWDECGGLQVHIDHGGGLETWYRHLSNMDVAVGATIAAGTVLGRVGNTGCSLGSHLHFAVRAGDAFVDPLGYLPPR